MIAVETAYIVHTNDPHQLLWLVSALMLYGHRRQAWQYEVCWRLNRTFHVYGLVLIGALVPVLPDAARADWWIVRSSDKQCLVVDIEPTGKDKDKTVTKIGKEVYPTSEEAEADVKRLCKQ
jgi:hypothetical protein